MMRRRTPILALAILALGTLAPTAVLAESLKKARPADIAMLLDAASGRNSAYRAMLIGETPGRVYIEYLTAVHSSSFLTREPRRVVYWLPRATITDAQLDQFRIQQQRLRVPEGLSPPDAK